MALVPVTGLAPAAAGTAPAAGTATKEPGLAGYHFSVGKTVTSMTIQGKITVPSVQCGSAANAFSPGVSSQYLVGTGEHTALVQLDLSCFGGIPVYGDAVLVLGSQTKNVQHPLKPGAVVTVTIFLGHSSSSVKIAYSKTSGASLKGGGTRPAEGQFTVALPDPPRYSPVKFSQCTVNGKSLSSFKPGVWESVTRSGKVNGKTSALSHGTDFTVSF